ncbi:MAG TPA: hypothetical protein VGE52_18905, partial [Pirellulales bacterium]
MIRLRRILLWLAATTLSTTAVWAYVDGQKREASQEKLASLQPYVGGWKGVGQPKRGSTVGAWTEEAEWAWSFQGDAARIAFTSPEGKYFASGWI